MSKHRAQWKGQLRVGDISCTVGLYTAASTSERISFHLLNKATGNRLTRVFIDSETEMVVGHAEQVKGFETKAGAYVMVDPDEVAAIIPESDKILEAEAFIPCRGVDAIYFDKPYYLVPEDDEHEQAAFAGIRDALAKTETVAVARTVLFRRIRTVLIRAHDRGLIATTLNFDYEIRSPKEAFGDITKVKVGGEMLDLARHIITTKMGKFDPARFDDRYEEALSALVKAKAEGKALPKPKPVKVSKPKGLLAALRESAGVSSGKSRKPKAANSNSGKKKRSSSTASKDRTSDRRKAS